MNDTRNLNGLQKMQSQSVLNSDDIFHEFLVLVPLIKF